MTVMSPGESESLWPLLLCCGVWTRLSPARGATIPAGRHVCTALPSRGGAALLTATRGEGAATPLGRQAGLTRPQKAFACV